MILRWLFVRERRSVCTAFRSVADGEKTQLRAEGRRDGCPVLCVQWQGERGRTGAGRIGGLQNRAQPVRHVWSGKKRNSHWLWLNHCFSVSGYAINSVFSLSVNGWNLSLTSLLLCLIGRRGYREKCWSWWTSRTGVKTASIRPLSFLLRFCQMSSSSRRKN